MAAPARILTVCTGNICRSPFLERALQAELDRSWGPGAVVVSSAGTGALPGHPMEEQARALLESNGYAADGFRARELTASMVADADLVLTASRVHRGIVATLHPQALRRVFTFREFAHLVSGLDDTDLHVAADTARTHLARVAVLAVGERGMRPTLTGADVDIVDPYRQAQQVFDQMTAQVMGALPAVLRALGPPAGAAPARP
jgi:protein-tyrosine phosphatase